jgi:isopentenyldiphosphate isomerase
VRPDSAEIADWQWVSVGDLKRDLRDNGERYAPWLPPALRVALSGLRASAET